MSSNYGETPADPQRIGKSERAAAARARIEQAERRRRLLVVATAVLAVLAIVAVLVIVRVVNGGASNKSGTKAQTAQSDVAARVTSVPLSVLNTVGVGTARTPPAKISAPALTDGGKPEVLYVGAEYCPYCAAERWALAVALSRFGTLTGLGQTASSPSDVYPSTPTLTFHGATYTSSTLTLTAREIQSNQVVNGQYAKLDSLTSAQEALVTKYDAPPYVSSSGGIPFVDIGGKYVISGASYDPSLLQGKTHEQIARALSDPTSAITQAIGGTANLITAAICDITSQAPSAVCTSSGVQTAATALGSSK